MRRIPDWSSLEAAERRRWLAGARARGETLDKALNAFVELEPVSNEGGGTLDGMPYAVKDMMRTPGHRPSGGLSGTSDLCIVGNSDLLDLMDAAGAIRIGFTQMTELAYEPSGFNSSRGWVRNPWSFDHVTGGSSSGSAAAVASGAVAVALGSDTGGSLRIPAHCCGITAWKPTYGLVSTRGAMPLAPTLDTIGLLARSANDLLPTARTLSNLPKSEPIRSAVLLNDAVSLSPRTMVRACSDLVDLLETIGTNIVTREALGAIEAIDAHALTIMFAESARTHRARVSDPGVPSVLRRRLGKGLEVSDAILAESKAATPNLVADFEARVLRGADAAVLPVMAIDTPQTEECDPTSDRFSPKTLYALSRWTRWVNALGFPAVALPVGFDSRGMPMAMQIVGRPGSDLALIELVRHVQASTHWHGRIPTASANLLSETVS